MKKFYESKVKLSGGWTVASLIDEAFAQATTLAWDFDDNIFFDNNYFSASLNKMPLNVANALYSIVYIIIRDLDWMGNVCRMMEEKLSSKPVFRTLRALPHRLHRRRPRPRERLLPPTPYQLPCRPHRKPLHGQSRRL